MPQKLNELNISSIIKQIEEKIGEKTKEIHENAVNSIREKIKTDMYQAEGLYYQYVRGFIDAMGVSSVEELGRDRDTNGVSIKSQGEGELSVGNYKWEGLAESTIRSKKKKRKPQAWVNTGVLKEWLRRQYTITKGSRFTGKLSEKVNISRNIERRRGKFIYNESIIMYQSPLHYFRPTLPVDLEIKIAYNEKKRPLFEPVRKAFVVDLLPRKLNNFLNDKHLVSNISKELAKYDNY